MEPQRPLPVPLSLKPMEAEPVKELPRGSGWLYEPKYDGFRCLAFRDRDQVELQSKKQKSLNRFFPEVAAGLARLRVERFVLDGELVIPGQSFETLQLRLHPAASRISELSGKFPVRLMVFDLLAFGNARLTEKPLSERREALKSFVRTAGQRRVLVLSKATRTAATPRHWLAEEKGLDGIVAKRLDQPYRAGERAMFKYRAKKQQRRSRLQRSRAKQQSRRTAAEAEERRRIDIIGELECTVGAQQARLKDRIRIDELQKSLSGG
jgi:ATP-dependent DNA ligase